MESKYRFNLTLSKQSCWNKEKISKTKTEILVYAKLWSVNKLKAKYLLIKNCY